jgi:GT2 family glycosyltransferase
MKIRSVSLIATRDADSSILLENAGCKNVELIEATSAAAADLNAAANSATGEVLVFVAAPVIGASTDWLKELAARALQKDVGAVGLKIADERDRIVHAGYILGINGGVGRPHFGYHAGDQGEFERLAVDQNFSAVSDECMAIRRELFDSIGGFDESTFPENYADIDLCLRLHTAWLRIVWTPWAKIRSASARELPHNAELAALKEKWPAYFESDPYYNPNLTLESDDLSFAFPPRSGRTSF